MFNIILSWFAWETIRNTGVNLYQVNRVTGKRRIAKTEAGGWQPVDQQWVDTGEWRKLRPPGAGTTG